MLCSRPATGSCGLRLRRVAPDDVSFTRNFANLKGSFSGNLKIAAILQQRC